MRGGLLLESVSSYEGVSSCEGVVGLLPISGEGVFLLGARVSLLERV